MFVNLYELKGFYTGMFISEVNEAYYCGLPGTTQDIIDESNYGFTNIIKNIDSISDEWSSFTQDEYETINNRKYSFKILV